MPRNPVFRSRGSGKAQDQKAAVDDIFHDSFLLFNNPEKLQCSGFWSPGRRRGSTFLALIGKELPPWEKLFPFGFSGFPRIRFDAFWDDRESLLTVVSTYPQAETDSSEASA